MTLPYFENFRKYLTKFEHSSENMEFYLWFSNYEKRYYTVKKSNENRWSKGLFNFKKKPKLEFICSNELPFNEEITLVVQLFLNPASSLELNLPSKIKEACLLDLNDSTHPDVFRPIFDHVAQLLSASWINFMRKIRGGKS
ncbi:hypothetical protein K502DRAFT_317778 [Neoconidiobolus thromboides FSU 785]|nr:hypothetical protein K502DRAFT_317778 [Neoconidiobolus thromboides FSU 785]